MATVGKKAQGSAITEQDSALTDKLIYFRDPSGQNASIISGFMGISEYLGGSRIVGFAIGALASSVLEGQAKETVSDLVIIQTIGSICPPWTYAAGALWFLSKHQDELRDEIRDNAIYNKAKQEFLDKVEAKTATKEDFIKYFGEGNAYGRKKFLAYIHDQDRRFFDQEIAIAGPDPYTSFADAERIGKEKGLPVPQPTIYEELKVQHLQLPSELYSDPMLLLNDEDVRNSLLFALGIPTGSEENQPTRIYISNGSVEDVAKSETEPDSNMISTWKNGGLIPTIKTPSQIMTSQFSHNLINPQTGEREGALDTAAVNTSPYQMDGLGTNTNGILNAQGALSERLAAALERIAEVCALPRVSVGKLAETAVVREEADLDTLARRFADDLLHAQLVS